MTPEPAATPIKTRSTLVDITNCIGCRACQVACKQWNDRPGEETDAQPDLGFQNPVVLSAKTLTLIKYDEIPDEQAPGGLRLVNSMWRCLHCLEPACVSSCPTTALERKPDGPVVYSEDQCIGCRYCMWACPWGVPSADWDTRSPKIHKCTHCADRCDQPAPAARNDQPLTYEEGQAFLNAVQVPACVKACPADALVYGDRDDMLAEARRRMAARPGRYVDHIYGEKEAGGTSVLYLSAVPFEKLGFPDVGEKSYPGFSKAALHAVPPAVMAVGALLGMTYSFLKRRTAAIANQKAGSGYAGNHHPVFEPLRPAALDALQPRDAGPDGVGRDLVCREVRARPGRRHAAVGHLCVGTLDCFRSRLDRDRGGCLCDCGVDLRLPAQRSVFDRPRGRAHGPAELLVRHGHAAR